ncbi:MAG: 50S ribosomal protein L20 [Anaerolineales bacterium]
MTRVKGGIVTRKRHKRLIKQVRGYYGTRHNLFRRAKEARTKSLWYSYRDRRNKKRNLRRLWIARINAAARQNGTTYSRLVHAMRVSDIRINRKFLADMAVRDPKAFASVVKAAKPSS